MLLEQIVASLPALTVAAGLMVRIIISFTALQVPIGSSVVSVNVIEPIIISAADGEYTAFNNVASLNVPLPEVVQVEAVALPP